MKISVVMQSYLGDYPGSRTNPEQKFIRAVDSFLAQTHNEKELIIVSDGCSKTIDIFSSLYAKNKEIKFIYIHKNDDIRMYEKKGDKTYHRGIPKKIGCSYASGDLITYLDSDDIFLPHRLSDISFAWRGTWNDFLWANIPFRYMNKNHKKNVDHNQIIYENEKIDLAKYNINDIYILNGMKDNKPLGATWSIIHKNNIPVYWEDVDKGSEDQTFMNDLCKLGNGFIINSYSYVLAHSNGYWGKWDN